MRSKHSVAKRHGWLAFVCKCRQRFRLERGGQRLTRGGSSNVPRGGRSNVSEGGSFNGAGGTAGAAGSAAPPSSDCRLGYSEHDNGKGGINLEGVCYSTEMGFDKAASLAAFKTTLYPLLRANCAVCHSTETRAQAPIHSDVNVNLAHEYCAHPRQFPEPRGLEIRGAHGHRSPQLLRHELQGRERANAFGRHGVGKRGRADAHQADRTHSDRHHGGRAASAVLDPGRRGERTRRRSGVHAVHGRTSSRTSSASSRTPTRARRITCGPQARSNRPSASQRRLGALRGGRAGAHFFISLSACFHLPLHPACLYA